MKKILIAGYAESTNNYQNALTRLSIPYDTLSTWEPKPVRSEDTASSRNTGSDISGYSGLILPGGGDIEPSLFGSVNKGSTGIDEALDRIQLHILDEFLQEEKPVLGICKGLQIINVYFGGTVIQNLPEASLRIHKYENGDKLHPIRAAQGTFIQRLYGNCPVTNSAHHQGIGTTGDGLLISAYSHDFVIEAMYHKTLPVFGVQWHPERMCFACPDPQMANGVLLLRYFLALL